MYTKHGHQIPGTTVTLPAPDRITRCGGFQHCAICREELVVVSEATVPLIDRTGEEPRVIGEAKVKSLDGWIEIEANVTDEEARKLLLPDLNHLSIMPDTFRNSED
jgi:hypothetical protein